jgi:hypothetical protein
MTPSKSATTNPRRAQGQAHTSLRHLQEFWLTAVDRFEPAQTLVLDNLFKEGDTHILFSVIISSQLINLQINVQIYYNFKVININIICLRKNAMK